MKLISCITLFVFVIAPPQDAPSDDVPELSVLSHYAGTWDVEFTIEAIDPSGTNQDFKGTVEAKWTVGGRFLDQTGTYRLGDTSPPFVIKTLMTFDSNAREYRYWLFISTGQVHESTGKWDEDTKTMTSTMKSEDGNVTVTKANFSQPGVENWLIETQRSDGVVVTRIRGKNTRRK